MKICTKCKENKENNNFGKHKKTKNGLQSWCLKCTTLANSKKVYNRKHDLKRRYGNHNHENGTVRGLLCNPCNIAIGNFKDDINRLKGAIKYLCE